MHPNKHILFRGNINLLFSLLLATSLSACIVEPTTNTTAYWKNETSHTIDIYVYHNTDPKRIDTVHIAPNGEFTIENIAVRGITLTPYLTSQYIGSFNDSTVVVFDGVYAITHYLDTPATFAARYYTLDNKNNINNPENYLFTSKKNNRRSRSNKLVYIFDEAKIPRCH